MKQYGDITQLHGDQIEPVSCITGGSPCQDLSIAGNRAGLAGERSGLFMEMVRVIKEMRDATNEEYPKFAIWENVRGAFSSNNGEDFRCVLEEFVHIVEADATIPKPSGKGGKWSKSGAISGNGWSLAWRLFDAQYWGVPQRRQRIALVMDFGGQRAAEILFERTGVPGNPDESIPTWQGATRIAEKRTTGDDRVVEAKSFSIQGNMIGRKDENGPQGRGVNEDVSFTLNTIDQHAVAYTLKIRSGCEGGGKGALVQTEKSATLSTLQDQTLFQPVVYDARGNGDGKIAPTITGDHENRITDYTAIVVEHAGCLTPWDVQSRRIFSEYGKWPALYSGEGGGHGYVFTLRWIVRRLTPMECERLQGYPDGWTDIGEWTDTKGKKHKPADALRYKALGNSIALPQWFWIVQKMKSYLSENATLGSLFDGIGGFPLVWETTYGGGTARWVSEIEEFCVAVTKKHFLEN